jgi:hypothetical protein
MQLVKYRWVTFLCLGVVAVLEALVASHLWRHARPPSSLDVRARLLDATLGDDRFRVTWKIWNNSACTIRYGTAFDFVDLQLYRSPVNGEPARWYWILPEDFGGIQCLNHSATPGTISAYESITLCADYAGVTIFSSESREHARLRNVLPATTSNRVSAASLIGAEGELTALLELRINDAVGLQCIDVWPAARLQADGALVGQTAVNQGPEPTNCR